MTVYSQLKLALIAATAGATVVVAVSSAIIFVSDFFGNGNGPKKKRVQRGVPGLYNLGNTCFANALLQSFAACPSFESWLSDVCDLIPSACSSLLSELRSVIHNSNHISEDGPASADGVLAALRAHRWNITPEVEQDLFELFNVFVTTWDEELAPFLGGKLFTFADVEGVEQLPSDDRRVNHLRCISELVRGQQRYRAPCVGLLGTELACGICGYKNVRHDRFCSLDLVLPKTNYAMELSIEMCLRKYFARETLFNYKCEQCEKSNEPSTPREKSSITKKQGISKSPDCLILRIQRVGISPNGAPFKHVDHVKFSETLSLNEFSFYREQATAVGSCVVRGGGEGKVPVLKDLSAEPSEFARGDAASTRRVGQQKPVIIGSAKSRSSYQLRAVVVHIGRPESGHFITYRRAWTPETVGRKGPWYFTSDTEVKKVSFDDLLNQEAYMLFYERAV